MQNTAELNIPGFKSRTLTQPYPWLFVATLSTCAVASAAFASWLPLQVSVVTVFLFAGPHNWFESRYFLMRLPVRFGQSRNFFLVAFAGVVGLTAAYVSLPFLFNSTAWTRETWLSILATWNTLFLLWLGMLIWQRGKLKRQRSWFLAIPVTVALSALNWLAPELFSLSLVYLHPLIALWFLDRHLSKAKPAWLQTYRRCVWLVPALLVVMIWRLSQTPSLVDDNGLFWRITQHSGAQLLPWISSHLLVSVHLFLEMLHYGVWLLALPLLSCRPLSTTQGPPSKFWELKSIPIARHKRGFPKTVAVLMIFVGLLVALLWFGFTFDYATTRDIYFTLAIAHVLAEAPFLLRML